MQTNVEGVPTLVRIPPRNKSAAQHNASGSISSAPGYYRNNDLSTSPRGGSPSASPKLASASLAGGLGPGRDKNGLLPTPAASPASSIALAVAAVTARSANLEVMQWDVHRVAQWLEENQLERFKQSFIDNDVTGDVLLELTYETLGDIGVPTVGEKARIIRAVRTQLRKKTSRQSLSSQKSNSNLNGAPTSSSPVPPLPLGNPMLSSPKSNPSLVPTTGSPVPAHPGNAIYSHPQFQTSQQYLASVVAGHPGPTHAGEAARMDVDDTSMFGTSPPRGSVGLGLTRADDSQGSSIPGSLVLADYPPRSFSAGGSGAALSGPPTQKTPSSASSAYHYQTPNAAAASSARMRERSGSSGTSTLNRRGTAREDESNANDVGLPKVNVLGINPRSISLKERSLEDLGRSNSAPTTTTGLAGMNTGSPAMPTGNVGNSIPKGGGPTMLVRTQLSNQNMYSMINEMPSPKPVSPASPISDAVRGLMGGFGDSKKGTENDANDVMNDEKILAKCIRVYGKDFSYGSQKTGIDNQKHIINIAELADAGNAAGIRNRVFGKFNIKGDNRNRYALFSHGPDGVARILDDEELVRLCTSISEAKKNVILCPRDYPIPSPATPKRNNDDMFEPLAVSVLKMKNEGSQGSPLSQEFPMSPDSKTRRGAGVNKKKIAQMLGRDALDDDMVMAADDTSPTNYYSPQLPLPQSQDYWAAQNISSRVTQIPRNRDPTTVPRDYYYQQPPTNVIMAPPPPPPKRRYGEPGAKVITGNAVNYSPNYGFDEPPSRTQTIKKQRPKSRRSMMPNSSKRDTAFFGERPPDELIAAALEQFFPDIYRHNKVTPPPTSATTPFGEGGIDHLDFQAQQLASMVSSLPSTSTAQSATSAIANYSKYQEDAPTLSSSPTGPPVAPLPPTPLQITQALEKKSALPKPPPSATLRQEPAVPKNLATKVQATLISKRMSRTNRISQYYRPRRSGVPTGPGMSAGDKLMRLALAIGEEAMKEKDENDDDESISSRAASVMSAVRRRSSSHGERSSSLSSSLRRPSETFGTEREISSLPRPRRPSAATSVRSNKSDPEHRETPPQPTKADDDTSTGTGFGSYSTQLGSLLSDSSRSEGKKSPVSSESVLTEAGSTVLSSTSESKARSDTQPEAKSAEQEGKSGGTSLVAVEEKAAAADAVSAESVATPVPPELKSTVSASSTDAVDANGAPTRGGVAIRWTIGKLIGQGAFGRVFLGLNMDSGELMAVKQVMIGAPAGSGSAYKHPNLSGTDMDSQRKKREDALKREIELLQELDHENIVRYLGFEVKDKTFNVLLEYVSGGSIASVLAKFGKFEEDLARFMTMQILYGLEYLHSVKIIHRDIKGANILVDADGIAKISDFGISKKNEYAVAYQRMTRMSMQGSIYWMAPEVARGKGYSAKVDIWSLGCLVLEMLTGNHPWHKVRGNIIYALGTGNKPPVPDTLGPIARDFLALCFTIDPEKRPTATDLISHPFAQFDPNSFDFPAWVEKATEDAKQRAEQLGAHGLTGSSGGSDSDIDTTSDDEEDEDEENEDDDDDEDAVGLEDEVEELDEVEEGGVAQNVDEVENGTPEGDGNARGILKSRASGTNARVTWRVEDDEPDEDGEAWERPAAAGVEETAGEVKVTWVESNEEITELDESTDQVNGGAHEVVDEGREWMAGLIERAARAAAADPETEDISSPTSPLGEPSGDAVVSQHFLVVKDDFSFG